MSVISYHPTLQRIGLPSLHLLTPRETDLHDISLSLLDDHKRNSTMTSRSKDYEIADDMSTLSKSSDRYYKTSLSGRTSKDDHFYSSAVSSYPRGNPSNKQES